MKVKGLKNKIYRLSPNGGFCSGFQLNKLKEGGVVDLKEDQANLLLNMGIVETVKGSKVKAKENNDGN